jgi:uncharacterized protein
VRLVLDTNTALSGLLWEGTPGRLIQAAETGKITIVSSVSLLGELRDVLSRDKFAPRLAKIGFTSVRVFTDYLALVTIIAPAVITPTIALDPTDDVVLATALGGSVDLIVSGDAHLLNLKSFHNIDIVTATVAESRVNPSA